jgi:drug/metabolite transporter (DMT)-like permease
LPASGALTVSAELMAVVLFGALLHAGWNALVRSAPDKLLDAVLVVSGAGALAAAGLPFLPAPLPASWPYLAASVLIHAGYFTFVALSYRASAFSFAYPLMRGTAPVLSSLAVLWLGEVPSARGAVGVVLVSAGVLLLAADAWRQRALHAGPTALALANAGVIALYTLVDGVGVRLAGNAFSYTGWMFLLTALVMLAGALMIRGRAAARYLRDNVPRGLAGGAATLGSYGLALWAMTQAPIALVAALRETSVVFGLLLAGLLLREPLSRLRIVSVLTVAAGAVAIRLA